MILVKVTSETAIYPAEEIPKATLEKVRARLTFENPRWSENEKHGYWNGDTPRELCFLEQMNGRLTVPRGFTRQALKILLDDGGGHFQIEDSRRTLEPVDFQFTAELREYQARAVQEMSRRDFGTLSAPTGSGKTVIALALVAERRQPALIVVHSKELLNQWVERIETFTAVPRGEIGTIQAGRRKVGGKITVALVQSLYKCAEEVAPQIGHLIIDECHRAPSRTFTDAIRAFDCRYMLGLSATPYRRDGLGRLIYWFVGDVAHQIDQSGLVETGDILEAEVIRRETRFKTFRDPSLDYSKVLTDLVEDEERNALIVGDVISEARRSNGVCLVLSDRRSHCHRLAALLREKGLETAILTGELSQKERQEIVGDLNAGRVKVLTATGQLIGEGFDCRRLESLFIATPIKFDGRLRQYVGRVLRPAEGKNKARVFDYVDPIGVLEAAARARQRVYTEQGKR